jgi:hypothetical protein
MKELKENQKREKNLRRFWFYVKIGFIKERNKIVDKDH